MCCSSFCLDVCQLVHGPITSSTGSPNFFRAIVIVNNTLQKIKRCPCQQMAKNTPTASLLSVAGLHLERDVYTYMVLLKIVAGPAQPQSRNKNPGSATSSKDMVIC
jgi:hypothetical protein